ncbi:MAG: Rieske 2Fe-2S domain-containing protein [Nitrososphaeraceae archaeon]
MSTNFVKVAETKDIQSSNMRPIDLDGEWVGIVNVDRSYYAIGNICTHLGGPLNEGKLEGYDVECPWDGSKFDVRTGEPPRPSAQQPVPAYEAKVEENSILVRKHQ